MLLSHAKAAELFHRTYQLYDDSMIGMSLNGDYAYPMTSSQNDIDAAQRYMLWQIGWFADPLYFGDYPQVSYRPIFVNKELFRTFPKRIYIMYRK